MNPKSTALLFSTVWPEPDSSAAGVRQLQWVRYFKRAGYEVILSSPSKLRSESDFGVQCIPLEMNRSSVSEVLVKLNPQVVMFDRFILEEQFGHLVYQHCPNALVLLETQDLHFVRRARAGFIDSFLTLDSLPPYFYHTDTALRETAAIERVDYSYLVSAFEEKLLAEEFSLGLDKVQWVPFSYEVPIFESAYQNLFNERKNFCWIGNFRHAPNVDGLRWFLKSVWPNIRKAIPDTSLNLYGAYPSAEVMGWSNAATGVISHGPAKQLKDVFLKARVNLAPLRFGAGVKGKILEGFRFGVPCVTTKVGSEGLLPNPESASYPTREYSFPGLQANDPDLFAKACIELYQNEALWTEKRLAMLRLLEDVYDETTLYPGVMNQIESLREQKRSGKLPSWNSKILRHELMNSHKYFSKWIEEKEIKKNTI
jgi:glycosyltransferase involved in cell wall biosynthesis